MREQLIFQFYKQQFERWIRYQSQLDINIYFSIFSSSIRKLYNFDVTYDINAFNVMNTLLKNPKYLHFDGENKTNKRRNRCQKIIRCLEYKNFIGKRETDKLIDLINSQQEWIKTKIIRFVNFCKIQGNKNKQLNWKITVNMNTDIFWQIMYKNKIKDSILNQLALIVPGERPMRQMFKNKSKKHIVKNEVVLQKNISAFDTQHSLIQLKDTQQCLKSNSLQENKGQIEIKSIQKQPLYQYKEQVSQFQGSFVLDSSQFVDQSQISEYCSDEQQTIQNYLKNVAYHYSLFYNENHRVTINSLGNFFSNVRQYFSIANQYNIQLFGSLKSTFALSSEYDIDLTLLPGNDRKIPDRKGVISLLFQTKNKIQKKQHNWIKHTRVYCFEKIPVPFLKIQVDPIEFQRYFKVENVTKIDITVGNKSAVINSILFSHYSKIPQIHYFCVLVKYWAKTRNVINFSDPMRGLSSYGVILMCIYYLMATNQISFIDFNEKDVEKIDISSIIPKISVIKIKSLKQNFRGFLYFYKEDGSFQKQKLIVSLLSNPKSQKCIFNDNFVINMYDFIDQTNPGRLVLQNKSNIFNEIERAIAIIKSNDPQKMRKLFD